MLKSKIVLSVILACAWAAIAGCQSGTETDSGGNANLTLVTLNVPNMT